MAATDTQGPKNGATRHDILRLVIIGLASCWSASVAGLPQSTSGARAIIASDTPKTVIGFIYSPAVLADLLARKADEQGSPKLAAAVHQNTPVVAMWSEPVPADVGPPLLASQWKIAVFPSGNTFGTDKIEPLWIEHDLAAVAPLGRLRQPFIGAVAAFPEDALSKGRRICLYAEYPPDYEKKSARSIWRCADLQ
jgi:hypothetical protein